ncbi:SAM-dependent chlorinase/fluorinase [Roseospira marina]|uniref:SAM-dependent chlorinase/fluorinase n=1 Tax=Roseospira marina TaxID=140057 RepID=A0A5M6IA21_9PROT|nr:SAM-dependent chlorinase/fluorinase [Roseospira marina]KAA5604528.1 SAM-dependent chlorinase/fluorinase [Roseospira marina]
MIAVFTDFGLEGPYTGQMKAALHAGAPGVPIIDLCADAPMFDPMASAYLLAALVPALPVGTVVLGVVDPGVGSERGTVMLEADGRWFVGPDNGLFAMVSRRAASAQATETFGPPGPVSASFHGRDLFAPAAARLARGDRPDDADARPLQTIDRSDWPDDLDRVVYIDRYGNVMTGRRASTLAPDAELLAHGRPARRARTFSDVPVGQAFWYENANGLAEIAVNQGRADSALGLRIGICIGVR